MQREDQLLFLLPKIRKLGFGGEDVTEASVTGAVRTFLKEGSDTSKNFSEGVCADFASFC